MRKLIAILATGLLVLIGLTTGAAPAQAATNEQGHTVTVSIGGSTTKDWQFFTIWETNYSAVTATTTEPINIWVCHKSGIGTTKQAKSVRVTWKNGRTGGIVNRFTLNATAPTTTCPSMTAMGDTRPYTTDIKVADFPTLDLDFYSGASLSGSVIGTVRGYEYQ